MEQRKCGHQILTATRIGSWHKGWSSWGASGVSAWSSPIAQVDMGAVSKFLAQLGGFPFSTARRLQRRHASCYPLSGAFKGAFINSSTCNLSVLLFDEQVHCLLVHSTLVKKSLHSYSLIQRETRALSDAAPAKHVPSQRRPTFLWDGPCNSPASIPADSFWPRYIWLM
jgi:hypothetical protein